MTWRAWMTLNFVPSKHKPKRSPRNFLLSQSSVMSGYQVKNKQKEYSLYGAPKVVKPSRESRYKRLVANVLNYFVKSTDCEKFKTSDKETKVAVPGGFFSENTIDHAFFDNSALSANPASVLSSSSYHPTGSAPSPRGTSPSSNAVLANFFKNKGDEPLSEVEIEGVSAIIRKAQFGDSKLHSSGYRENSEPESIPATLGILTQPKKSMNDEYSPSYERQELNVQQHGRKRVFDFSAIPTPYQTGVIYKPHDLLFPEKQKEEAAAQPLPIDSTKLGEKKGGKLSATASTLISLLADSENSKGQQVFQNMKKLKKKSVKNKIANPYPTYSSTTPELVNEERDASSKIADFKNVSRNSKQNDTGDLQKDSDDFSIEKQRPFNGSKNVAQPKNSAFTFSFTKTSAPLSSEKVPVSVKESSAPTIAFGFTAQNKQPKPASAEEKTPVVENTSQNDNKSLYTYNFPDPLAVAENHLGLDNQQVQSYKSMFPF